jgi:hypothetical protein
MATPSNTTSNLVDLAERAEHEEDGGRPGGPEAIYCPVAELNDMAEQESEYRDHAEMRGEHDVAEKHDETYERLREMSTCVVARSPEGMSVQLVTLDLEFDDFLVDFADEFKAAGYEEKAQKIKRLVANLLAYAEACGAGGP